MFRSGEIERFFLCVSEKQRKKLLCGNSRELCFIELGRIHDNFMSIWNFMFPTIYYILIVFYQQQHFDFTRSPLRAGPQLNIGWNKGIHLIWNIFNRVTDNSIFQCKWSFLGYMIYIVFRMKSGERNSSENFVVILLFNHLLFSAPGRFCAHGLQVGKCVISKYFITDFLLSIVEWTISFLPRTFEELWKSFWDMKFCNILRSLGEN